MEKAKPFLKWVGGKRGIMNHLLEHIPNNFNTYYEPFIGGGALLLELQPTNAVINDYNEELINVYECIKDKDKLHKLYEELDYCERNHSQKFFLNIRAWDRDKESFNNIEDYKRASRTIYLNHSCFNGLYRVNRKNQFNSSFNHEESVTTYEKENLVAINNYLSSNNVTILSGDFEEAVKDAKQGDFIYFDPPYDSDTEVFTRYTENCFNKADQVRLAKVFKELSDRGCYVMLSNYNTTLINELYKDYNITIIEAVRRINPNASQKIFEEVIITNY